MKPPNESYVTSLSHAERASAPLLQGVSKGGMVDRVLNDMSDHGGVPDFVLCIGDDRSDEDMFLAIEHVTFSPHMPAEVCQSPSQS